MKNIMLGIVMVLALTAGIGAPVLAASPLQQAKTQACIGINESTGGTCGGTSATDINHILAVVLNVLAIIAGIAAVIMIVIAGLKYITSGGDAQEVASAKRSLIYAVVGLIVVAFAQFLVHFVLASAAGK